MKEYLFKSIDGTYKVVNHDCQGRAIEIPEGAEFLTECMDKGVVFRLFWKGNYKICVGFDEDWYDIEHDVNQYINDPYYNSPTIVWQRHNQPEELPFLDDGPMTEDGFKKQFSDYVNIKFSEASESLKKGVEDIIKQQSERFNNKVVDKDSKLGNFVVDDTLNQRQSQYGDFSKVAEATQGLMFVANSYSYQNMSDSQKEAIHMIFSKISRLLNGDPNHVDSWHDIAGYATLVVKDIS